MPMPPLVPRMLPILLLLLLLLVGGGTVIVAQERRGPTTLENLLQETAEVTPQGTVARPRGGSTDPAIAAAWKRYDKDVRAASANLLHRIDEELQQSKTLADAAATAGLETARKAFVEQGSLPSMLDAGLKTARRDAETAYQGAALALRKQYDTAATHPQKAEHAEALIEEWALLQIALDLAQQPQLDSTWKHSIANGPSAEIALYSNGRINSPEGPDTWRLTGTTLTIRWQNAEAPGGEWVDTCEVSAHGGAYSGTNQLGTRISGARVP